MNSQQKLSTWGFIVAVAVAAYNAPWEQTVEIGSGQIAVQGYAVAPLWARPTRTNIERIKLEPEILLLEWLGISLIYLGVLNLTKTPVGNTEDGLPAKKSIGVKDEAKTPVVCADSLGKPISAPVARPKTKDETLPTNVEMIQRLVLGAIIVGFVIWCVSLMIKASG